MDGWSKENWRMIQTEENLTNQRKTCASATLSTTNPTWTGFELKLGVRNDGPETAQAMSRPHLSITEPFLLPTDAHNVKKTQSY